MTHDDYCEWRMVGWRYCNCAERAYYELANDVERIEWLEATGREDIDDLYRYGRTPRDVIGGVI